MSVFRVDYSCSFASEDDAIAFLNSIEEIKTKTSAASTNGIVSVKQECSYHECFHDEDPPSPCGEKTIVDFGGAKVKHKTKADKKMVYTELDTTPVEEV